MWKEAVMAAVKNYHSMCLRGRENVWRITIRVASLQLRFKPGSNWIWSWIPTPSVRIFNILR